jgi:hypothetical protein
MNCTWHKTYSPPLPNTALHHYARFLFVLSSSTRRRKKKIKRFFEENGTNKKRQKDGRKITLRGQEDAILGNPLNGFDEEITDSQTVAESLSQLLEICQATK